MPNPTRRHLLRFDPYGPWQDPPGTVALAQLTDMVYAVEQRHHDAIAQPVRRDGVECGLERRRLDGDPNDVELPLEPIGDLYRRLEGPQRLAPDGQPLGVVISAAGPHEQGHRMAGLGESTAHEPSDPARSENRVPHLPPPSPPSFVPHSIQSPQGPEGSMIHRTTSYRTVNSATAAIARKASSIE